MFSRAALAIFLVIVAEYFAFGFAAQLVGASLVIWISLAVAVLGFVVIRRSFAALLSAGAQPFQTGLTGVSPDPDAKMTPTADAALGIVSGILLVIPGLVSGVVGLALLLPAVRGLVRGKIRQRTEALISQGLGAPGGLNISFANGGQFFGRRDVVEVNLHADGTSPDDTVDDDGPTTVPPELQ